MPTTLMFTSNTTFTIPSGVVGSMYVEMQSSATGGQVRRVVGNRAIQSGQIYEPFFISGEAWLGKLGPPVYETVARAGQDLSKTHGDGLTSVTTEEVAGFGSAWTSVTYNRAPTAPTLLNPSNGANILSPVTLSWRHNDPDGDPQNRAEIELLEDGNPYWDTIINGTASTYELIGLAYESLYSWRVRTEDSSGTWGPWSGWRTFTPYALADAPTITSHSTNDVVGTSAEVTWTADPFSYDNFALIQRVADNSGVINTNIVYAQHTTGASPFDLSFPTNGRFEWIRLATYHYGHGLLSEWATVRVEVDYSPPPKPTVAITSQPEAIVPRIRLVVTNPASSGPQPETVGNTIWRQMDDGIWEMRGFVEPNGTWYDYEAASDKEYNYIVAAEGDDGSRNDSDIASESVYNGSWLLKAVDQLDVALDLFVENQPLDIESPVDQAKFAPLGRRMPIIVSDVIQGDTFSMTLQFLGNEPWNEFISLRERQVTMLLQTPMEGEQWYIVFGNLRKQIENTSSAYRKATIECIEVETSHDPLDDLPEGVNYDSKYREL
jgi:hypothetical protein